MDSQDPQIFALHIGHIIIRLQSNLECKVVFILKLSNSNVNGAQKGQIKSLFFQPKLKWKENGLIHYSMAILHSLK